MGGANKLKWTEKIENSVIDPLQLAREDYATGKRKGVIPKHIKAYQGRGCQDMSVRALCSKSS